MIFFREKSSQALVGVGGEGILRARVLVLCFDRIAPFSEKAFVNFNLWPVFKGTEGRTKEKVSVK
jgi:hypothetical protein